MGEEFFDNFTGPGHSSYSPSTATRTLGKGWELDDTKGYISNDFSGKSVASTYIFNPEPPFPANGFTIFFSEATTKSVTSFIELFINGIEITSKQITGDSVTLKATAPTISTIESIYFLVDNGAIGGKTTLYSFSSDLYVTVCLAPQSKILTLSGYKELQDIQRGEQLPQGRVARVIETSLSPNSMVEITALGETLACSNHTFISQGKRVLAKDLGETKRGKAKDLLLPSKDGKYKLLDIQFDFEGSYTVSGLTSQSRSPYCKISPLPKELYWNIENYKEIRVENTLYED